MTPGRSALDMATRFSPGMGSLDLSGGAINPLGREGGASMGRLSSGCLLYTSDAADE